MESARTMTANQATNNRASTRLSTYSMTPTLTPSLAPSHLSGKSTAAQSTRSEASLTPSERTNPLAVDIRTLTSGLARLDDQRLQSQRYVASGGKEEELSKLALGAKLERALGRRMSGQDAVFTKRTGEQKVPLKAS